MGGLFRGNPSICSESALLRKQSLAKEWTHRRTENTQQLIGHVNISMTICLGMAHPSTTDCPTKSCVQNRMWEHAVAKRRCLLDSGDKSRIGVDI
jgi:hypothetical protein